MANTPPCDICQTAPTDLLITNVHNGDTLGICMEDVPAWAETIVRMVNATAEQADPGTAAEAEPAAPPRRPRSRPAKAAKGPKGPTAAPEGPGEPSGAPGAAEGPPEGSWTTDEDGYAEPATA